MPARVMRAVLTRALADAKLIDDAKKALMYGKDRPVIAGFRAEVERTRELHAGSDYSQADLETGLARIHAALGMRTEADEILQQELDILCGKPVKPADQADELGDLLWYGQLYLNATGWSLLGVVQRNVAKLIERFKGLSYTTEGAVNRDKSAEAQAQEAVS
ncbi:MULTISPECIES: MazG nucleotide pyrophosphohydrolase domain-containing protein [unclassified Methylobacterium]|uniref:MazG nucleotide pyrophosphohydrolase domain-containing protein n=1 Tax=unclassified Methylobacterium TaxID=2615210 RepID=UPI00257A3F08|nr:MULTISPECIES: MazG nucleotide pyrophosphohydrolase domain-containing protein [unclassified Methylobacterium]